MKQILLCLSIFSISIQLNAMYDDFDKFKKTTDSDAIDLSIRWSDKERRIRYYFFNLIKVNDLETIKIRLEQEYKYAREEGGLTFSNILASEGLCYAAKLGRCETCALLLQYAQFRLPPRNTINPLMKVHNQETAATIFTNFIFLPSHVDRYRSGKAIFTLLACLKKQKCFPTDLQKLIAYHTDAFADYMIQKILIHKKYPKQFLSRVEKRLFDLTIKELEKMRLEVTEQNLSSNVCHNAKKILESMCAQCQYSEEIKKTIAHRLAQKRLIFNGEEANNVSLAMQDTKESITNRLSACTIQ